MKHTFKGREICDIEIDGIDHKDYPDFVDAYIYSAYWKDTGKKLTDKELEELQDDGSLTYDLVIDYIY